MLKGLRGGDVESGKTPRGTDRRSVGSELVSNEVPMFMLGPLGLIFGSTFCVGAYPMEAVRRCVSVDGAQKVEGRGAP